MKRRFNNVVIRFTVCLYIYRIQINGRRTQLYQSKERPNTYVPIYYVIYIFNIMT